LLDLLTERIIAIVIAGGPLAVFLALVLESACVPVPSEVVLPLASILVTRGSLSFWTVVAVATAGQMTGSLLSYAVGRYGGRPLLLDHWARGRRELAAAEAWFGRHGETAVFVGRLLPGIRTFISVPAGLARMSLVRFVAFSLVGTAAWTTVLVWAGTRVVALWEQPAWRSTFRTAEVVVFVLLAGTVAYLWGRSRSRRNRLS